MSEKGRIVPMNIDERLEALAQTVELLSHSVLKHDEVLTRHDEAFGKIERTLAGQQALMHDIMEAIGRLANTAAAP